MSFESVMPSNHHILCHPLLLLPSIFPSIRVSSSELSLLIRWSKYWSFSFSISPSKEYSGLMSFRMDLLDLLEDSQESPLTPQFKSINSLALSFLHSPTLTCIHDHWKHRSLDQTDLCWQSGVSAFWVHVSLFRAPVRPMWGCLPASCTSFWVLVGFHRLSSVFSLVSPPKDEGCRFPDASVGGYLLDVLQRGPERARPE